MANNEKMRGKNGHSEHDRNVISVFQIVFIVPRVLTFFKILDFGDSEQCYIKIKKEREDIKWMKETKDTVFQ